MKIADSIDKSILSRFSNLHLEKEFLGRPIWLTTNDYHEKAMEFMGIIDQEPDDLWTTVPNRLLHQAYKNLSESGRLPTRGAIQSALSNINGWTDNETDKSRVTPGYISELEEQGRSIISCTLGWTAVQTLREPEKELWELRRLRNLAYKSSELQALLLDWPGSEAEDQLCDVIAHLSAEYYTWRPNQNANKLIPLRVAAERDIKDIEANMSGEVPQKSILSGFAELDDLTGGFKPGNLVVVAGRPSMGKTAFMLDVAWKAVQNKEIVLVFSLEMTIRENVRRLAAKAADIPLVMLREGLLQERQLQRYRETLTQPATSMLLQEGSVTPHDIAITCRDLQRQLGQDTPIGMIVVDHAQLLGAMDQKRYERRERQISAYTSELKALALELGSTVILGSQLSREIEKRSSNDRLPKLSDLRDSGSLEQDADIIIGIHRPYMDSKSSIDDGKAIIGVIKNRNGKSGKFELTWTPPKAKFSDPDFKMNSI